MYRDGKIRDSKNQGQLSQYLILLREQKLVLNNQEFLKITCGHFLLTRLREQEVSRIMYYSSDKYSRIQTAIFSYHIPMNLCFMWQV